MARTLRVELETAFASARREHLSGKVDFSQRSSQFHLHAVFSQDRQYSASLMHNVLVSCVVGVWSLLTSSTMFSDPKISYVAVKYF